LRESIVFFLVFFPLQEHTTLITLYTTANWSGNCGPSMTRV